jgi:hypothetical protein
MFNALRRKPATLAIYLVVASISLFAPVGKAGLIAPTLHPVVIGGMTPDGNGNCIGQFTITTDQPAEWGWAVSILWHLDDQCQPVVDLLTTDPTPAYRYVPAEPHTSTGGTPKTFIAQAHGTFNSDEAYACGEDDCAHALRTLQVDNYQQWHTTSGKNVQGDNTAVQCNGVGSITVTRCDKFLGPQSGTEIAMSGHGEAGWTTSDGRSYTMIQDVTLYTNSAGAEQATCTHGGTAPAQSPGICRWS